MKSDQIPFERYQKIADALVRTAEVQPDLPFVRKRGERGFIEYTYRETLGYVKKIGNYQSERPWPR